VQGLFRASGMVIYHHRAFLKTKRRFQLSIRWVTHAEHGWVISAERQSAGS
jgi:hypothetical protein